jgi:aspartate-semialdehyde dehydrogenase
MDELYDQTKGVYVSDLKEPKVYPKRIAFNLIPHIDKFMEGEYAGYTKEEWKMIVETKKILDPAIDVTVTCVRVPVFIGHSETVNVEFVEDNTRGDITEKQIYKALRGAEGVKVVDERKDGGYMTPFECAGEDDTFVSRIRMDNSKKNACNLWIVSDNIRKGAALNSIQIAEELIKDYI